MIRRLTDNDNDVCFELLKTQAAENLFIIGDIEAFGYDQDFQKLWGQFNETGELIAVLLKFEENYIPFSLGELDAKGFAEIIVSDPAFKMISGLQHITEKIEPYLGVPLKSKRKLYYAKCTNLSIDQFEIKTDFVQKANPEDAEALVELLQNVPEFSESTINVEKKRRDFEAGIARSFYIIEDGKMVSTASTTAENSLSAMVVGVATLKDYKKKGYATQCMVKLCAQLLKEGKELCLFYDNPEAGNIYKRIGFEDIGFWMMNMYERS